MNRQLITDRARQLLLEAGAWDKDMQAHIQHRENMLTAIAHNRKHNTINYLLNPAVSGPVRELGLRTYQGATKLTYDVLRDGDSPRAADIKPAFKIKPEAAGQPWNIEHDILYKSLENLSDQIDKNKSEHPILYYLNPFVSGRGAQTTANATAAAVKTARQKFSIFSPAGSTIEPATSQKGS